MGDLGQSVCRAETTKMRCVRCGRFIGEDCLEGHDGTFFGRGPGSEDGYTGVYYCAAGVGCNVALGLLDADLHREPYE
jgi:hypothetical protein